MNNRNFRLLVFKALAISLFSHLLDFSFVVFSFSVPQPGRDPLFLFLGPILQKRDVVIFSSQSHKRDSLLDTPDVSGSASVSWDSSSVSKPGFSGRIQPSKKILFKLPVNRPVDERSSIKTIKNDKEFSVQPYEKLKLY